MLRPRMEAAIRAGLPVGSEVSIGSTAISYRRGTGLTLDARESRADASRGRARRDSRIRDGHDALRGPGGGRVDLNSVTVTGPTIDLHLATDFKVAGSLADRGRQYARVLAEEVNRGDGLMRRGRAGRGVDPQRHGATDRPRRRGRADPHDRGGELGAACPGSEQALAAVRGEERRRLGSHRRAPYAGRCGCHQPRG